MTPPDDTPAAAEPSYLRRLADPAVRGYLVAVLAALAVVFVANFQRGGPAAGLLPLGFALPGLLLRWAWTPALFLVVVAYLQFFPFGAPIGGESAVSPRESYFALADVLFVGAVVVYLAAQFRLYALTDRAYPDDRPKLARRPADAVDRRPAAGIGENELPWLFGAAGLLVLGGQLAWLVLDQLEVSVGGLPGVRLRPPYLGRSRPAENGMSAELSRFLLLVFAAAAVVFVGRLAFGLWRLARLTPDEGRLVLLDTAWREQRRELARLETWRAYPAAVRNRPPKRPAGDPGRLTFAAAGRVALVLLALFAVYLIVLVLFA